MLKNSCFSLPDLSYFCLNVKLQPKRQQTLVAHPTDVFQLIVHLVANPSDLKQITMSVFGRMNPSQESRNGPNKLGMVLCM